jgi:hypothetical protein
MSLLTNIFTIQSFFNIFNFPNKIRSKLNKASHTNLPHIAIIDI